jgi:hypothetical protein
MIDSKLRKYQKNRLNLTFRILKGLKIRNSPLTDIGGIFYELLTFWPRQKEIPILIKFFKEFELREDAFFYDDLPPLIKREIEKCLPDA